MRVTGDSMVGPPRTHWHTVQNVVFSKHIFDWCNGSHCVASYCIDKSEPVGCTEIGSGVEGQRREGWGGPSAVPFYANLELEIPKTSTSSPTIPWTGHSTSSPSSSVSGGVGEREILSEDFVPIALLSKLELARVRARGGPFLPRRPRPTNTACLGTDG